MKVAITSILFCDWVIFPVVVLGSLTVIANADWRTALRLSKNENSLV